jgi:DNA-nicking Smr family endonuclease
MFDDKIDFHNYGLIEPNQIKFYFENFIEDSYIQKNKFLLIITGKGESKMSRHGLVKKTVLQLIKSNKRILKFTQADDQWGGNGAFEVWLKD